MFTSSLTATRLTDYLATTPSLLPVRSYKSGEEFDAEALAREYYGRAPSAVEAAGVLMKLHAAPMYFYKKGRGRYKAAPEDALKAALASVERKKQQAAARDERLH